LPLINFLQNFWFATLPVYESWPITAFRTVNLQKDWHCRKSNNIE
jgi:hypothetical protein